jgi:hypothetical protein
MTDATSPPPADAPGGAALTREEKRAVILVVLSVVVAFAVGECVRRMERRIARRHPVLTELVEGMARPPWHAR